MKNIIILSGGWTEPFASLKSAKTVISLLKIKHSNAHIVNLDPADGLLNLRKQILDISPDVIINLVHGYWGEDGYAQIFLDKLGFPYTGPSFQEAHTSMNKHIMHELCKELSVPIPKSGYVSESKYIEKVHCYPHIIKPIRGGSSYGIDVINNENEKINHAAKDPILIYEEIIDGPELCIAIKKGKCLGTILIDHDDQIYTVHAKNTDENVRFIDPKIYGVSDKMLEDAKSYASKLYNHVNGRGIARIDFKVTDKPYFIDYNSIPGMVLIPRILKLNGYSDEDMIDLLIN
ncbi:D-alanine--D-alanine ligase family protein [Candidatus Cytomitobacter indipagum]|nr:ATP-grasp domain-containing protein [Candidatus Cytomitobacter indipagum]